MKFNWKFNMLAVHTVILILTFPERANYANRGGYLGLRLRQDI